MKGIRKRVQEIKMHFNAKDELKEASSALERGSIKQAVRSAAAAVEASVRHYAATWGVNFPRGRMAFTEKVEKVLRDAGKPSYQSVSAGDIRDLLCLYRARSKIHEGDCYYADPDTEVRVMVRKPRASELYAAARRFVLWLDSLA